MFVEPYVEQVQQSMPFNFTEFAEKYNITMPGMFQSEESPRPGLELAKQVPCGLPFCNACAMLILAD